MNPLLTAHVARQLRCTNLLRRRVYWHAYMLPKMANSYAVTSRVSHIPRHQWACRPVWLAADKLCQQTPVL